MEAQRCSLSLSLVFLTVLLDSGTAGKFKNSSEFVPLKRLFGLCGLFGLPRCWFPQVTRVSAATRNR